MENIRGFIKLTEEQQKMFMAFLENFKKSWGLEARETIEPISVEVKENEGKEYLKFVYKIYNKKEWLHVKNSNTWY